ncbi:DUF3846 domain-containing protein [Halobacillus karajensis]|uniref:DUF3846 domain-containing protein n=1 Tax=Halobacillus karajensis TaxID=195088 RepID=UPI00045D3A73|nr:DUF3846 domain-containing protein [Halobacillus karajensis]CDQ21675.1 hypothetical protein BN982_04084 [Halobacillus karajensis]
MAKELTIVKVEVGEAPEVMKVEDTLETYQAIVGGELEAVNMGDYYMILNEERIIRDLPLNFSTVAGGFLIEKVQGDVFFISTIGENFASLDKQEIHEIKEMFAEDRNYMKM